MHNAALGGTLGVVAWALGIDYGPLGIPGGKGTVFEGRISHHAGREACHGPVHRIVIDTATDATRSIVAGGPSGHVGSRSYVSEVHGWRRCEYKLA